MASFTGIDEASAEAVLGASVVSGTVNSGGHLILTRGNGETFDAGDFSAILTSLASGMVNSAVATAVQNATVGKVVNKGAFNGYITFTDEAGGNFNNSNIINALITLQINGPLFLDASLLPSGCRPNTQFVIRIIQDAIGDKTLSTAGFYRSQGILPLTNEPEAIDIIVCFYDGSRWYAGYMGMDMR